MLWQPVSEIFNVARKLSEGRIKFWGMKFLWRRERRYVAILNMEVWKCLARLAPDVPDGWSFPDGMWAMPMLHRFILTQFLAIFNVLWFVRKLTIMAFRSMSHLADRHGFRLPI